MPDFTPNLELDGPYEIALHSLETYYSFANVDETNNKICVFLQNEWNDLEFAVGCYKHKDINAELQRMCDGLGAFYVDVQRQLRTGNMINKSHYNLDGYSYRYIHLNEQGAKSFVITLVDAMKKFGMPLRQLSGQVFWKRSLVAVRD